MDPNVWGPHLWFVMHTISFNYPKEPTPIDKINYYNFFYNLTSIIPCNDCKTHFIDFFKKNPIRNYLINRDKLIEWVMNCHNNVNKLNNKPEWNLDQVFKHYQEIFLKPPSSSNSSLAIKMPYYTIDFKTIIICFLILIIIYLTTKKNT